MYSSEEENEYSDFSVSLKDSGGPYNIDFKETYKPVFIIFLDMIISITFVMVSTMYFWI